MLSQRDIRRKRADAWSFFSQGFTFRDASPSASDSRLASPQIGDNVASRSPRIIGREVLLWLCFALAAALRFSAFPHGLSPTDTDEPNYLVDGLNLIEGVVPGHKYAPSGPLTWFSALYAGVGTLFAWLHGGIDLAGFSPILRPVAALEATLFHMYADMSSLRLGAVSLIVLVSLLSVIAMYRLGYAFADRVGALTGGLLAASVPIYVELSLQTRPYAIAWAFALLALAGAGAGRGRTRSLGAGILMGVAIGSHIDMARVAPVMLLLRWRRAEDGRPPWREFGTMVAATLVTFLIVAPWYVTHLIDNLRQILSVRILPPAAEGASEFLVWWKGGITIPCAVTTVVLILAAWRRAWVDFLCGVWLLANAIIALRVSSHGLWHDGALVVGVIALTPLGIATLQNLLPAFRRPGPAMALVLLIAAPTLWQGAAFVLDRAPSQKEDDAVAWIEAHVPPGTKVYTQYSIAVPLPTPEAAERLWTDVAAPDAWVPKYLNDTTQKFGLHGDRPLRVMSEDRLAADRAFRRRYYILGAPLERNRPRYDLWEESEGSFYDLKTPQILDRLCREGGVYIHHGAQFPQLPTPAASWRRQDDDRSTYIYWLRPGDCSGRDSGVLSSTSSPSAPTSH